MQRVKWGERERGRVSQTLALLADLLFDPPHPGPISAAVLKHVAIRGVSATVKPDGVVFTLLVRSRATPEKIGSASFGVPMPICGYFEDPDSVAGVVDNFLAELMEDVECPGSPLPNVLTWD